MSADLSTAIERQHDAADPQRNIFVSANAGSGKTTVLVNRVTRLLLAGTQPDKILCLTFTKAAAAEMQTRLYDALGGWAVQEDAQLTQSLQKLDPQFSAQESDLRYARGLFARALETPGGLKIQTIHAFCERLLRLFPLEAGLVPGMEAIDDFTAQILFDDVVKEVEDRALAQTGSALGAAIAQLAAHSNDQKMDSYYGWIMNNRDEIDRWAASGGGSALRKRWGLGLEESSDGLKEKFWADTDRNTLKRAIGPLQNSGTNDQNMAGALKLALGASTQIQAANFYIKAFKKKTDGEFRAQPVTKKAGEPAVTFFGAVKNQPTPEIVRVMTADEKIKQLHITEMTEALFVLAEEVTRSYQQAKRTRRIVDFNDQILVARALLRDQAASDWVRYKLDGGIEHILVDEAQDTSAVQWDIINALSEEVLKPSVAMPEDRPPTFFAVGDEKQSIYSFQGAAPEEFLKVMRALTENDEIASPVHMQMSFRSAPTILNLVDKVFIESGGLQHMFDAESVSIASDKHEHIANRGDQGIVEVWAPAPTPKRVGFDGNILPVPADDQTQINAQERTARAIADYIRGHLDAQTPINIRAGTDVMTRPCCPSDFLILVKTRLPFFDAVIRNLKQANVPVAGADRLQLTDALVIKDLLALGRFCLLPSDDLSLAELLKSPLFGWDDAQLYAAAVDRPHSLWQALEAGSTEKKTLSIWRSWAREYPPYEFYSRVLSHIAAPGEASVLKKMYARFGNEAQDVVGAFLDRSLSFQNNGEASLTRFIAELSQDKTDIKRSAETEQDEVRVMTIHGAKGLEAPWVILPDTNHRIDTRMESVLATGDDGFAVNIRKSDTPEKLLPHKMRKDAALNQEALRLLYVGLTRAESRLLVCGFENARNVILNGWLDRVTKAVKSMDGVKVVPGEFGKGYIVGTPPGEVTVQPPQSPNLPALPEFLSQIAAIGSQSARVLSPSRLGAINGVPVRSPLDAGETFDPFSRGNLIHHLLEILPDLPIDRREAYATSYLQKQGLASIAIKALAEEVLTVLNTPEFSFLFAESSKSEVALVGHSAEMPPGMMLNGAVDRLCITDDAVWVIDYKSNRPAPKVSTEVAPLYLNQMAAYRSLCRELYPGWDVKCALLWTDIPRLMELPTALLDAVDLKTVMVS